jgi:ATP-dependent Clp protease ATP-binding subunit ClpA
VDEIISFAPLGRETLEQVAMNRITRLTERLREKGITVRVDESFLTLALAGAEGGARSVCRRVAKKAEELLAGGILDGTLREGCDVMLYGENGLFQMKISSKNLLTNGKKCV